MQVSVLLSVNSIPPSGIGNAGSSVSSRIGKRPSSSEPGLITPELNSDTGTALNRCHKNGDSYRFVSVNVVIDFDLMASGLHNLYFGS